MLRQTCLDTNVRIAVTTDSPSIARVRIDSWRTAYKGIIAEDYLARISYVDGEARWSQAIDNPRTIVLVAEDALEKTIVGFVSGGANRAQDTSYAGELYAIYVLKEFRGKGIGRKLVRSFVQKLIDRNIDSMLVWVLAKNPYRQFYELLGGQYVRSQEIQIGEYFMKKLHMAGKTSVPFLRWNNIALNCQKLLWVSID